MSPARKKLAPSPATEEAEIGRIRVAWLDWVSAAVVTLVSVHLHWVRMGSAGGLWRDEAAAHAVAISASLGEMIDGMHFEVMPILPMLVIRIWSAFESGASDEGLRWLGFLVGIGTLGATWVAGFLVGRRPPTLALALVGLNPLVIIYGDSVRPYGLAMIFVLLTIATVWRAVDSGDRKWWWAALASALLCVQTSYQNVLLLGAACAGGLAVALFRRETSKALLTGAVAAIGALSLVPYLGIVRSVRDWSILTARDFSFLHFWNRLAETIGAPGAAMVALWAAAVLAGPVLLIAIRPARRGEFEGDRLIFAAVGSLAAVGVFLSWIQASGYASFHWHYLPLTASLALYLETARPAWVSVGLARSGLALVGTALLVAPTLEALSVRFSNARESAYTVMEQARAGDLVVVNPWYNTLSFSRYYDGEASLLSVPSLGPIRSHRWDLVKIRLDEEDPLRSVRERIERALRSGDRVFLVGTWPRPFRRPVFRPPASQTGIWDFRYYLDEWTRQMLSVVATHARDVSIVVPRVGPEVSRIEDLSVTRVEGWRGGS